MDRDLLRAEITRAMRARDRPRLSILRMVKNEVDIVEKESRREATDEDVLAALKKVLRQTGETLEGSRKAGTDAERTGLLRTHVDILTAYLPEQVTGEALAAVVDRVLVAEGISERREMGKAIAAVAAETDGNCDKAEVARIVGERLS